MDTLRHYIVLMRHRRLWIVGPFATMEALSEWGDRTQRQGHDDPRWQSIELPDSAFQEIPGRPSYAPVQLMSPTDPEAIENGQPD